MLLCIYNYNFFLFYAILVLVIKDEASVDILNTGEDNSE